MKIKNKHSDIPRCIDARENVWAKHPARAAAAVSECVWRKMAALILPFDWIKNWDKSGKNELWVRV